MNRVCLLIQHIGDYHAPRLRRLSEDLARQGGTLKVFQAARASSFYAHEQSRGAEMAAALDVTHAEGRKLPAAVFGFLRSARPTHIVVLGYSNQLALLGLACSVLLNAKLIFLSDSKADDQERSALGEAVKSALLKRFDAGLVAGDRHRQYFRSLGFKGPMETGYDVIDNDFFAEQAHRLRGELAAAQARGEIPQRYVLCVSRLVERKRVDRVLTIFRESGVSAHGCKLLLIGDGPLKAELHEQVQAMGLGDDVVFMGNVANARMPMYYGGAAALVLASEYDQWGLCVNEALVCGTPVLISERCGAANEIVLNQVTGYVFDGDDVTSAGRELRGLVLDPEARQKMSEAAIRHMGDWNIGRFSSGLLALCQQTARDARRAL